LEPLLLQVVLLEPHLPLLIDLFPVLLARQLQCALVLLHHHLVLLDHLLLLLGLPALLLLQLEVLEAWTLCRNLRLATYVELQLRRMSSPQ